VQIPEPPAPIAPPEDDLFGDLAAEDFAPLPSAPAAATREPSNPYQAPQSYGLAGQTSRRSKDIATRGARFLGALVDGLIYFAVALVAVAVSPAPERPEEAGMMQMIALMMMFPIAVVQWVLIAISGQSIGKKIVGTRIVDANTYAVPSFLYSVVLRNWVSGLLGCVPFFGLIDALWIFGEEHRCVHDLIAGTRVVNAR